MSEVVQKADKGLSELKTSVMEIVTKPAPPLSAEERSKMTEAIKAEASRVTAKMELGRNLFVGRSPGLGLRPETAPTGPAPAESAPAVRGIPPATGDHLSESSQSQYGQIEGGGTGVVERRGVF